MSRFVFVWGVILAALIGGLLVWALPEKSPRPTELAAPSERKPVGIGQPVLEWPFMIELEKVTLGRVPVIRTIGRTEVEGASQGVLLAFRFRIQNGHPETGTYTRPEDGVSLVDEHGNRFAEVGNPEGSRFKWEWRQIDQPDPPVVLRDAWVFSPVNFGKGEQLLLELPARAFSGKEGSLKFRVEQKTIPR